MQDVLARFVNGKIPGVQVVWQSITGEYRDYVMRALSAGTAADIIYVDVYWAKEVISTGTIQPLDEFIAKSKILKKADLIPALVNAFTVNGKLYAVSKDFNSLVVYYNKDMFDAMKVPYPNNNDTWATLLAKIARVNNPPKWYGACINPDPARYLPFAFAAGMPLLKADGSAPFDLPAAKEAADWFTSPIRMKVAATSTDIGKGWPGAAFVAEKAAVVLEGGWLMPPIRNENPTLNFGTAYLPTVWAGGPRGNYLFTVGYAMPKNPPCGRPDLVFKVIETLTSPEVQNYILESGHAIPSRKALLNSPFFQKKDPFAQATKTVFQATGLPGTVPFTFGKIGAAYINPVKEALTSIMQGQASVEDAMNRAAVELNKTIQESK